MFPESGPRFWGLRTLLGVKCAGKEAKMIKGRVLFPILGLLCAVGTARASMSYQASSSTFATKAGTTDGLTIGSLITFDAANLVTVGTVSDDEYVDAADGIDFYLFGSNGTTQESFTVTGGVLLPLLSGNNGDTIEIVFTSAVYGLGFNFTTTNSTGDNLCLDTSVTGCNGNVFASNGGSSFIGALNDNPGPAAALPALWIHPLSGSANTEIESYEFATGDSATPEVRTMLTLGVGLLLVGLLKVRGRPAPFSAARRADRRNSEQNAPAPLGAKLRFSQIRS
jgi:hypothetical protein